MTNGKFEIFIEGKRMGNRLSVVLNGRRYTRSGVSWIDEKGIFVPAFLVPALDRAITANTASKTKNRLNMSRGASQRR